jgi:two-component system, sensor histidine kinase SagS
VIISDQEGAENADESFLQELARRPETIAIPVVLLAALQQRMTSPPQRHRNVVASVSKPIRARALRRALALAVKHAETEFPFAVSNPGSASTGSSNSPSLLAGLRVLVVEDNAVNQRVVEMQLKKLGCHAEFATNGLLALKAVESARFDVILMDCQMPVMDGYEATRHLRLSPNHARLYIIAMTANAMDGDRERCIATGMNDYLAKPIREGDLRAALERAVDARRSGEATTV